MRVIDIAVLLSGLSGAVTVTAEDRAMQDEIDFCVTWSDTKVTTFTLRTGSTQSTLDTKWCEFFLNMLLQDVVDSHGSKGRTSKNLINLKTFYI